MHTNGINHLIMRFRLAFKIYNNNTALIEQMRFVDSVGITGEKTQLNVYFQDGGELGWNE